MIKKVSQDKLIDSKKLPQHLAIIMDGNGRWAKERGLPRSAGHREGVKAVKRVISNCISLNIPILTIFAFSTENWKRPKNEVLYLLKLFNKALNKEKENFIKNNIRINFLGRIKDLPDSLIKQMNEIA
ncbi:MAG: di-trans,poly-cis-decaprenylcistransferase, partial [Candidatus Atribacteria bacterium]|nr:di-trans,poly-cis-decaprenylcistransferase [Candidatus Atribacteria bacterium]